jgi:hypothetical protein
MKRETILLAIDVDGPLNPYGAKPHQRPVGYATHRLAPAGHVGKPYRVWLCPEHGALLTRFAADRRFELVWATTWQHDANRLIGPRVGLPELPVIEFDGHPGTLTGWKYPAVLDYAAGRPLAWLDDDFRVAYHRRAREEFEAARAGRPTLLHHVDPRIGLTELDLAAVARWADREVGPVETAEDGGEVPAAM